MQCRTSFRPFQLMFGFILLILTGVLWSQPAYAQIQSGNASTDTQLTHSTCPVTVGETVDPEQWINYKGQRVYFCCGTCKRKFERNPHAYLANLPTLAAATADNSAQSHVHNDDEHEHTSSTTSQHNSPEYSENTHDHEHSAHEHHENQENPSGVSKLIAWLGKFHPASVHFPIALLIGAAVAEFLLIITRRSLLDAAARFCVWFGCIGALGSVTLGWFLAGVQLNDSDWIMTTHRWLGTAIGLLAVFVLTSCHLSHRVGIYQNQWRIAYRIVLFVTSAMVAINGFLGGALIYGLNHYTW